MAIADFDTRFGGRTLDEHAAQCPSSNGDRTPPKPGVALAPAATARVNHSRWIADCPFPGCGGAEYVSFDRSAFFCSECRNAAAGNVPVVVQLPNEKLRGQVETVLEERPVSSVRNWTPDETVADLQAENDANDLPVKP